MICIIALIVFSIMGIFSVTYRQLAAKAFDCVFRRLTLRPCQSGLDRQVKTSIISFFSKKNVKIARFVAKYFEILSWTFLIIMIVSMFFTAQGIYNYVVYGNCNGQNSTGICVYDLLNPLKQQSTGVCTDPSMAIQKITGLPKIAINDPSIGPKDAKVTIVEFGCFSCPNTKLAEPTVKQLLKKYNGKVRFVYKDFPLPNHNDSATMALAAACAQDQGKYWEYHDVLFGLQGKAVTNELLIDEAKSLGMDSLKFSSCLNNKKYLNQTEGEFNEGLKIGIYGTPTFFINNRSVVGPSPYPYFRNIIDDELGAKNFFTIIWYILTGQ
jgi:predicted DsbA family dithiol-disulfide isomerase